MATDNVEVVLSGGSILRIPLLNVHSAQAAILLQGFPWVFPSTFSAGSCNCVFLVLFPVLLAPDSAIVFFCPLGICLTMTSSPGLRAVCASPLTRSSSPLLGRVLVKVPTILYYSSVCCRWPRLLVFLCLSWVTGIFFQCFSE